MGQYKIRRLIRSQPNSDDSGLFHPRGVERLFSNLTSRSNTTSGGSSTPADHDQHNVPKNVVIIIIAVVSILLVLTLSTGFVMYLRRRKPRRMELTEAGNSEKQSINGSVTSNTSKATVQSVASLKYPPALPAPPPLADHNRATATQGVPRNAIPRPAVKTQAVPASLMPRLTESSITPVLPTMFFPELRVFRSPSPGVQNSLARPGQTLKVMNATPLDFTPVPRIREHYRKMSYTDLPKIRTDLVKKNGKITVPPLKPQRPASMGSATLSRANTQTKDTGTATSSKPQGPRPLPLIPRVLHPGYRGDELKSKSLDGVF